MQNLAVGLLLLVLVGLVLGVFLYDQFGPRLALDSTPVLAGPHDPEDGPRVTVSIGTEPEPPKKDADRVRRFIETGEGDPDPGAGLDVIRTDGVRHHTVLAGETLAVLAERYFGSVAAWRRIADANPEIRNPNAIKPGLEIVIPARE